MREAEGKDGIQYYIKETPGRWHGLHKILRYRTGAGQTRPVAMHRHPDTIPLGTHLISASVHGDGGRHTSDARAGLSTTASSRAPLMHMLTSVRSSSRPASHTISGDKSCSVRVS